jgi:DNA-binding transcriptional LysR family regulator
MLAQVSLSGIRAFEAVARRGSFRAAAGELNLSPSAVSHAIVKLERAMGVTLFDRSGRTVALTASGQVFMRHVGMAFDELRRGLEATSQRGTPLLRLHCAPSFAANWLSPRLPRFFSAHPGIEVRLSAGTDYARFNSDEFDADIVYGAVRGDGLTVVPLVEETVAPMCTPELAARIASAADLLDLTLIQSDNKQVRWPQWFEANGLRAPTSQGNRFDRSFLAIAAAVDGLGICLESTLLAERELRTGRLVMPLAGRASDIRYIGHRLVYPPEGRQRRIVRLFADWLLAETSATIPA